MEKFNAMRTRLLQHLQKKAIRSRSIMTLVCLLLASASAFAQTNTYPECTSQVEAINKMPLRIAYLVPVDSLGK